MSATATELPVGHSVMPRPMPDTAPVIATTSRVDSPSNHPIHPRIHVARDTPTAAEPCVAGGQDERQCAERAAWKC